MIKSTRIYSLSFLCSNLHGLAPFLGNKKGTTLMVIETNKTVPNGAHNFVNLFSPKKGACFEKNAFKKGAGI